MTCDKENNGSGGREEEEAGRNDEDDGWADRMDGIFNEDTKINCEKDEIYKFEKKELDKVGDNGGGCGAGGDSRRRGGDSDERSPSSKRVLGTPEYLAPELLLHQPHGWF